MKAIAIDGPAGAGKSTLAKMLAQKLGYTYVDTGALYRAVGLKLLNEKIDIKNEQAVAEVLKNTTVDISYENGTQIVWLDGQNVGDKIRTPEASQMASDCSALPAVRAFLLEMQRSIARQKPVVMDGRDIGTVVLPQAEHKIFLTTSAEIRAKRRYDEMIEKGMQVDFETVLKDLKQRDYNDSHRAIAPLKPAEDSQVVDTGKLNLQESLDLLLRCVQK